MIANKVRDGMGNGCSNRSRQHSLTGVRNRHQYPYDMMIADEPLGMAIDDVRQLTQMNGR
jgi:hypothetical protein